MYRVLFLVLSLLVTTPTLASEELAQVENITQIATLIRWSGVFFSVLVIAATWVLIKFMNSMVESIGSQFAQYRMLLQKLQSFLQFFIYMTAGLIVFMMSFRINDQILTLIGGTLAVSVGFALKDLAASFIAGMTVMIDRPFQVGDRVWTSPAVVDGVIYFGSHDGHIYALGQ